MSNMNINVNKHPTLNGIEVQIQRCRIKFFENGHKDNKDRERDGKEIENIRKGGKNNIKKYRLIVTRE